MRGSPYLAMGMRIAGAHHGAAIFKYLDMIDVLARAQFLILRRSEIHYTLNVRDAHGGQSQIMTR